MTISVNIAEAKAKFSSLMKAALAGEEVVVGNAGVPQVRLVPIDEAAAREARAARRRAAFGRYRGQLPASILDEFAQPAFTDEEVDAFDVGPTAPDNR